MEKTGDEKKNKAYDAAKGCLLLIVLSTVIWVAIPDCSGSEDVSTEEPETAIKTFSQTDLKRLVFNYEEDFKKVVALSQDKVFRSKGLADVGTSILAHDIFFEKLINSISSPENEALLKNNKLDYRYLAKLMIWYNENVGQESDSTRLYRIQISSKLSQAKKSQLLGNDSF